MAELKDNIVTQLAALSREQLNALLTELLAAAPELNDWFAAALVAPAVAAPKLAPAPKPKQQIDTRAYRSRVRGIMHSLDHMRASEAYWHVGGLADELREVEQSARELLDAGDAESALRVLLTLLEESYDGFEHIDDSNGELGQFLDGTGVTLAEVILSLDLNEDEREDLLSDLDELHTNLSNYGVDGLEVAIAAAQQGWSATPVAEPEDEDHEEEWDDDEDDDEEASLFASYRSSWQPQTLEQQLTRAKLNVLERRGEAEEYLALCLQTGEHLRYALKLAALGRVREAVAYAMKKLRDADEALKLARQLHESKHLAEALKVGAHGLQLAGSKAALGEWLAPIEEAQGRKAQALAAWLATFHSAPSLALWQTIQPLAGRRWNKLKPELMATLQKSWDKQALASVLLHEQEWDAASQIADKNHHDYRLVALVADALVAHRPDWVIRASLKQVERLIAEPKSKYYPYAAEWLRRVKAGYDQQGRVGEWQKYLAGLKEEYRRRPALMAHLNRL